MTPKRGRVEKGARTRTAILDATERIMLQEGYAAVSSRRVATAAGLQSKLLHYHFRTMDDLFVAVFQRLQQAHDERFAMALGSLQPIRRLWDLSMDTGRASLIYEFRALATHRRAIKVLMARSAKRDRRMHVAALGQLVVPGRVGAEGLSPMILALLMASVARTLVTEQALGVSDGHADMRAFIERHLTRMDEDTARQYRSAVIKSRKPIRTEVSLRRNTKSRKRA